MTTQTITYAIKMIFDNGDTKILDKEYETEAKAEEGAYFLLGGLTPRGMIVATHVIDSNGNILNEFEF